MPKRKRIIFPAGKIKSNKINIIGPKRRYTLLPSPSPQSKTSENSNYFSSTSTPIPVRLSHSASQITQSPIIPYQPSPITSPIRAVRQTKQKPRKKNKTRRVVIFHPTKSEKRPKTQARVQTQLHKEKSTKLGMQKVAPLKNQPQQNLKKYKSIKVETGTVDLQVCCPTYV